MSTGLAYCPCPKYIRDFENEEKDAESVARTFWEKIGCDSIRLKFRTVPRGFAEYSCPFDVETVAPFSFAEQIIIYRTHAKCFEIRFWNLFPEPANTMLAIALNHPGVKGDWGFLFC